MISMKAMSGVLPVIVLLSACGSPNYDGPVVSPAAPVVSEEKTQETKSMDTTVQSAAKAEAPVSSKPTADVAALEAEQKQLIAQKAELEAQKQEMEKQKASVKGPGDMKTAAFGNFMANAQAVQAVDQAKVDKIIQAAMDLDIAGLIDAIQDLIADLVAAIADVQAKIDAIAAKIAAAKAK